MSETPKNSNAQNAIAIGFMSVAVFVILLISVSVWYFDFDFPSGIPALSSFVAIFFREIIVFLLVSAAFIFFVVGKLFPDSTTRHPNDDVQSTQNHNQVDTF